MPKSRNDINDGLPDYDITEDYSGDDLSDDPMLLPEEKLKKRKTTKNAEEFQGNIGGEWGSRNPGAKQEPAKPVKKKSFWKILGSVLSGSILSKREMRRAYPFMLFVAFLAFVYIWNVLHMQGLYRREDRLRREIKELKVRSQTLSSMKNSITKRSAILDELKKRNLPLYEPTGPDKVIHLNSEEL